MPARLTALDRLDAVLVGVCRRDPAVVVGARVEVVVVAVDAGLRSCERLLVGQQPEAGADLHRQLGLDRAHGRRHARAARARSAHGRWRRCSTCPALRSPGLAGALEDDLLRRGASTSESRRSRRRLRAVAAVLGADAALRVHQQVELHLAGRRSPGADSIGRASSDSSSSSGELRTPSASSRDGASPRSARSASASQRPVPVASRPCQARRTSSRRVLRRAGRARAGPRRARRSASPDSPRTRDAASTGTSPKLSISSGFVSTLDRSPPSGR